MTTATKAHASSSHRQFALAGLFTPVIVLCCGLLNGCSSTAHADTPVFTLSSPDLANGVSNKFVLNGFGCTETTMSPALEWSNVPTGTKSLAIQVHDDDAPTAAASGIGRSMTFRRRQRPGPRCRQQCKQAARGSFRWNQ